MNTILLCDWPWEAAQKRSRATNRNAESPVVLNSPCITTCVQIDISKVKALVFEGIPNNAIRRRVWMLLLHIDPAQVPSSFRAAIVESSGFQGAHAAASVVARDVERSLWSWVPDAHQRSIWRTHLLHLIHAVLNKHIGVLHYYQGYHDIAAAVLLTCGTEDGLAVVILERISLFHLRDYMAPQLADTVAQLNLILPLLRRLERLEQQQAHRGILPAAASVQMSAVAVLEESECPPFFALSWVLTWASHVISGFSTAVFVADVMIGSHPLLPIYLSAAIILKARSWGLAELPRPYQMPHVHHYFSTFPTLHQGKIDYQELIKDAMQHMARVPPATLLQQEAASASIPPTSILFKYPYSFLPADSENQREREEQTQTQTQTPRLLGRVVGLLSLSSVAAITAYLYASSLSGT